MQRCVCSLPPVPGVSNILLLLLFSLPVSHLTYAVSYNSVSFLQSFPNCYMSECLIFLRLSRGLPARKHTVLAYHHFCGSQCL